MAAVYPDNIINEMKSYYAEIYNNVGLKNIEEMVSWRLREEDEESRRIAKIEQLLNLSFAKPQRHLIIGTGTGGLAVELYKRGCEVSGIEPNSRANNIVRLKARVVGMPEGSFTADKAEFLPFKENSFDFIHCVSVIEHVDDVEKSLNEMIRVLKPGGRIYLSTPNYLFPYERHYKIAFPVFLPKFLGRLYLFFRKRPGKFYKNIKLVNEKNLNRILYRAKEPVIWQRFYEQYSYLQCKSPFLRQRLWYFFTVYLNIPMNQEILILKKDLH